MGLFISTKVTLFCIFLVFIVSSLIGATFYYGNSENLFNQGRSRLTKEAEFLAPHLLMDVKELSNDVDYLSELPILHELLINAEKLNKNEKKNIISPFFKFLLKTKSKYLNIKIIDSKNREIELNIDDRLADDDEEDSFPDDQFIISEKANVNLKISKFSENRVYLTPIKLYRKKLEISGRRLPVIEAIKPISFRGEKIGLLIITANLKETFKNLKNKFKDKYQELYLTNSRGDYLINPFNFQTFGFESGKEYSLQKDFIKSISFLTSGKQSITFSPGLIKSNSILHLTKIFFDKYNDNRFLVLGLKIDLKNSFMEFNRIRTRSIALACLLLVVGGLSAFYFIRVMTRNLWKITAAAQRYANGHPLDLNIHSNDEIGILANTFAHMIKQISDRTNRLRKSDARNKRAKEYAELAIKTKDALLEDLKKVNQKIEKIFKEKDDLMAIVSHDLKNPLSIITANLELLSKNDIDNQTKTNLIRRSLKNSSYATNLITDLLELSTLEAGIHLCYDSVDLTKLVSEVVGNLEKMGDEKNIVIKLAAQEKIQLQIDSNRFRQVLYNLIINAIKFTANNGNISIELLKINDQNSEFYDFVSIRVKDDGVGIPYDKLGAIFDKYQQARLSDSNMGSGLGLAICKNIVDLHGGKIFVDSVEYEGAVFTVFLPCLTRPSVKERTRGDTISTIVAQEPFKDKKVLIVDDDEDLREILKLRLEKNYFSVDEACNGVEALNKISEWKPQLVLLDLEMPIMSGEETLKRIRQNKNKNELPIIIHSGNLTANHPIKKNPEINGCVSKNVEFSNLLEKIKELLLQANQSTVSKNGKRLEQNGFKILLVDDSDDIYALYKIYFKKEKGIQLDYADSGKEAIQKFKKGRFDLIFLDINMPQMSGQEVIQKIRRIEKEINRTQTPIIANSSINAHDNISKLLKLGFTKVLDKQVTKKQLLEIIHKFS